MTLQDNGDLVPGCWLFHIVVGLNRMLTVFIYKYALDKPRVVYVIVSPPIGHMILKRVFDYSRLFEETFLR